MREAQHYVEGAASHPCAAGPARCGVQDLFRREWGLLFLVAILFSPTGSQSRCSHMHDQ